MPPPPGQDLADADAMFVGLYEERIASVPTAAEDSPDNTPRFAEAVRRLEALGTIDGLTVREIRPVSELHQPFSMLQKVQISTPVSQFNAYVKQYRLKESGIAHRRFMKAHLERAYRITQAIHDSLAAVPGYAAPRPLACFPDLLIVVYHEAPGETVFDLVTRKAWGWPSRKTLNEVIEACRRCGEWLNWFQRSHEMPEEYPIEGMWDYVDHRLRRLILHPTSGFSNSLRRQVQRFFQNLEARSKELDLRTTVVHGDFALSNVLVHPSQTTVLDWPMCKTGSVYHDVTYFHHHLDLLRGKPTFRPSVVRQMQAALLDGYLGGRALQAELFDAFRVLHHSTHFLGLVEAQDVGPMARWYNRRICQLHLESIDRRTRL